MSDVVIYTFVQICSNFSATDEVLGQLCSHIQP